MLISLPYRFFLVIKVMSFIKKLENIENIIICYLIINDFNGTQISLWFKCVNDYSSPVSSIFVMY